MKQIVVFGGSFNPPLNSHFLLAQQVVDEYKNIERVLFVPVGCQYQKDGLISDQHRYQMLRLVCDKNEMFEVSTIEIYKQRQFYTIETLTQLQKEFKNYEICFMMGSDNLKELETWSRVDELVQQFKIYIFERGNDNIEEIIKNNDYLMKNRKAFIKMDNQIKSDLSSTLARKRIRAQKSIQYLAPEEVVTYIKENNLYER